MKSEIIKDFNLPNYVKGKSFAEASKAIEKKFEERKDPAAMETKQELMSRLAKAQEHIKMKEALKANSQEVPDRMDGQVPEGFEEFSQPNQMGDGGMRPHVQTVNGLTSQGAVIGSQIDSNTDGLIPKATSTPGGASGGMGAAGIAGMADTALELGTKAFGDTGVDTSGLAGRQQGSSMGAGIAGSAVKGASAGAALGPWGAAAGAVIGGAAGLIGGSKANKDIHRANMNTSRIENNQFSNDFAYGGGVTDPTEGDEVTEKDTKKINQSTGIDFTDAAANSLFARTGNVPNPSATDLNYGKYGDVGYFQTGNMDGDAYRISNTQKNPHNPHTIKPVMDEIRKLNPGKQIQLDYKDSNSFAHGGPTHPVYGPKKDSTKKEVQPAMGGTYNGDSNIFETYPTKAVSNNTTPIQQRDKVSGVDTGLTPNSDYLSMKQTPTAGVPNITKPNTGQLPTVNKYGAAVSDAGNFLNEYGADIARTAPVAMNALQLANLKRSPRESLDRLDSRYKTDYVDERVLENKVQNENNNIGAAMANASNGSMGALRNGLLGASANKTKALSEAYLRANDINRNEDRAAQRFNSQNDRINLRQSTIEKENNARDEGAYQSTKAGLQNALAENVGAIGKEVGDMKTIAKMFGYTVKGKYIVDKQGKVVDKARFRKELKEYHKKNGTS